MTARYTVDHGNLSPQDHLVLKKLRLYYDHGLTQAEIGSRIGFSRAKVSKLVASGERRWLVKVEIAEPTGSHASLELTLEDRFGIGKVLVSTTSDGGRSTELSVGGLAMSFSCDKVVPLVGGIGLASTGLHSNRLGVILADKIGAEALQIDAAAATN